MAEEKLGSLLFNGNCATCHHLHKASSAPTITEIRRRYKEAFPQKELFIKQLATWVKHPKKETSIMHDAIEKYELMPELAFDKESLEIIAEYLYEGKIEATTR
jgi:cytochrome c551/c552